MDFAARAESSLWKPPALRTPVLIFTVLLSWGLIAVLQYHLHISQRDNGIIFATRISDLPLRDIFLYLYFPTILAVIFSIYWSWIDLETKRLEPYYQLSKENGALGKDSLLLSYPYQFILFVPFKAVRRRHWPVFCSSLAIVLVTWGIVPTQSGIFSVRQVTRNFEAPFNLSNAFIPADRQAKSLTYHYAQSAYAIATLNETLPPFMALDYTLAPFTPPKSFDDLKKLDISRGVGTLSAPTTKYFFEIECEDVSHQADEIADVRFVSQSGCNFTLGLDGNQTIGPNPSFLGGDVYSIKKYTGMHVGLHDITGMADYSLSGICPKNQTSIFYAAFQRNKVSLTPCRYNLYEIVRKAGFATY